MDQLYIVSFTSHREQRGQEPAWFAMVAAAGKGML